MSIKYWLLLGTAFCTAACGPRVSLGDQGGAGNGAGGAAGNGQDSGGSGPSGTAGSPTACAEKMLGEVQPLTPDCPSTAPKNGEQCEDRVENGICVWQTELENQTKHGYHAAGCYTWLNGKVWWGVDYSRTEPAAEGNALCPLVPPKLGDACDSSTPKDCIYPNWYCECGHVLKNQFLCTDALGGDVTPPVELERLCTPPQVDESTQVKDLKDAEARAWCAWSQKILSHQGPYFTFAGARQPFPSSEELPLCAESLSTEDCVSNLRTQPCTATLAEVDDCLETLLSNADESATEASPQTRWIGHGCAPLLNNPTCSGIVVQHWLVDEPAILRQCLTPLR